MRGQAMKYQLTAVGLACAVLLGGCGGGSDSGSGNGSLQQSVSFPFPGGPEVTKSITLNATASSGGPVTYVSNTPTVCSVSGATLSLLKAGECSVNANQVGGNGYAAATARQLFVVPKIAQLVVIDTPAAQPVGASVQLVAASNLGAAYPITFGTTTPAICSVAGATLTTLIDGLCEVTASQSGGDTANAATATKIIVVGNAAPPTVTFADGYSKSDIRRTAQGGAVDWYSSEAAKNVVAADGSTYTLSMDKTSDKPDFGGYFGLRVFAPNVTGLAANADTTDGVHIDKQKALKFNVMFNPESVTAVKTKLRVWLLLGHSNKSGCNVTLEKFMTPVFTDPVNGVQEQTIPLTDFGVTESCGLGKLDPATELTNYPISKLEFNVPDINNQVPNAGTTTYTTSMTMGKITFE